MSRKARAPTIGVTGPDRGGWPAWSFTAMIIRAVGGLPRRITPGRPLTGPIDGLVIGGGADVSEPLGVEDRPSVPCTPPSRRTRKWLHRIIDLLLAPLVFLVRWLGSRRSTGSRFDVDRDRIEQDLLQLAEERGLPVLGICRGSQLMSIVRGGSLIHDLDQVYEERPSFDTILPRRAVSIQPHSKLAGWLQCESLDVNSLHRHAVDRPGEGLRVVARDDSGVVQAIEDPSRPFWVGVQWHPEYMPQRLEQRQLFAALVQTARAGACRLPAPQRDDEADEADEAEPLQTSAA